jgi:hypothetical protein
MDPGSYVRETSEGTMRGNVLQTWTPAWLVLTAVLAIGAVTKGRYRMDGTEARRLVELSSRVPYCAAPAASLSGRQPGSSHVVSTPRAAAMLLMVMARHGQLAGQAR